MHAKQHIEHLVHLAAKKSQESLKDSYPDFAFVNMIIRVDFSSRRRNHLGGMYKKGPGINMSGYSFLSHYNWTDIGKFYEYPSYNSDPVIGEAYCATLDQYVFLNVGHEVAHACQANETYIHKLENVTPHGELFQRIYTRIRLELNKYLPDQQFAHKRYQELLARAGRRELYGD